MRYTIAHSESERHRSLEQVYAQQSRNNNNNSDKLDIL